MCKFLIGGFTLVVLFAVAACSTPNNTGVKSRHTTPGFTVTRLHTFHNTSVSWDEAQVLCSVHGGQLFTPEYDVEAKAVFIINKVYSKVIWTGLYGVHNIELTNDTYDTYFTQDGRILNANAVWAPGQPDSAGGKRRCVGLMPDSTLTLLTCDTVAPYVCQYPGPPVLPAGKKILDEIDMTHHVKYTFQVQQKTYTYHWILATWSEARECCSATGAQLLSPESGFEAGAVLMMVNTKENEPVWTGVSNPEKSADTYVDLDGNISNFGAYWAPGQPDSDGGRRRCVALLTGLRFTVLPCQSTASFVCKLPAPAPPSAAGGLELVDTELLKTGRFESLVKNEIRQFPQKEQLQVMASILREVKQYANRSSTDHPANFVLKLTYK